MIVARVLIFWGILIALIIILAAMLLWKNHKRTRFHDTDESRRLYRRNKNDRGGKK